MFESSVVDILLTSLASGAHDWPSCAIASKQTTNVKKRRLKLKSSYATNFDFKCPIQNFSSCSLDKTTSKTGLWRFQFNQGKKFYDI